MRWSVLGDDGHVVSGSFDFGVAGAKGAAPRGVETLSSGGGGRGGEDAAADGVVKILGRWLGIVAASVLFGGFVLLAQLRRRRRRTADADADAGADGAAVALLRGLAPVVWLLVVLAAVQGVFSGASSGTGDGFDLGLLTASASGVSDLVRALVVALLCSCWSLTRQRARLRDGLYLGGGAAVLLTYALSGHALAFPSFWALLDQGVHVLAAGLWLGGVIALALAHAARRPEARATAPARSPRSPPAALGVAIVTGVLAAVREVDRWYFLRWSDYGRVVIVKAILVALVALGAGFAWWRARRDDGPGRARGCCAPRRSASWRSSCSPRRCRASRRAAGSRCPRSAGRSSPVRPSRPRCWPRPTPRSASRPRAEERTS